MHSFQPHHRFTVYKPAFQQDSEAFKYKKESELMLWEWPDFCEVSEWSLTLGGVGEELRTLKESTVLPLSLTYFQKLLNISFGRFLIIFQRLIRKVGKESLIQVINWGSLYFCLYGTGVTAPMPWNKNVQMRPQWSSWPWGYMQELMMPSTGATQWWKGIGWVPAFRGSMEGKMVSNI